MKTTPLLLLLFIIFLSGCNSNSEDYISKYCPGSCTTISGKLTTANGVRPIADTPVLITWEDYEMFGGKTRKKGITRTDANGNYELRFLIRDDEIENGYYVVKPLPDAAKYVYCSTTDYTFGFYDLERNEEVIANYNIPEKAYIEFQLQNRAAMEIADGISTSFTFKVGKVGEDKCYTVILWDEVLQDRQLVEVAADQNVTIRSSKRKNGVDTVEETTLLLEPGERKVYKVEF